MKCPRCGDVIHVEHVTGQEYADFVCAACEDEQDEAEERGEECSCGNDERDPDDIGWPCDSCGGLVR